MQSVFWDQQYMQDFPSSQCQGTTQDLFQAGPLHGGPHELYLPSVVKICCENLRRM